MKKIAITHQGDAQPTVHTVYTQEEADANGVEYKYWRDVRDAGEWALSDDGYVAECLHWKEYTRHSGVKVYYMRFAFGYILYNPKYNKRKLRVEGRSTPHTMSGKSQEEKKTKSEKLRNLARTYAICQNRDIAMDMAEGGSASTYRKRILSRAMKTESFQKMVREELAKLFSENGITEQYVIDLMKNTIDMAEERKRPLEMMKIIENLQTVLGMTEKKQHKTTDTITFTEHKFLEELGEERKKLEAKREVLEDE